MALYDYVKVTANKLGVDWNFPPHHKIMTKFHTVADGSPTFASSILRLARLGFDLPKALDRWEGSSGDEARRFAFQRELAVLKPSAVRTLYAACLLRKTSLIELKQITEHNETVLEDDIGQLRNYHLIANDGDYALGGARLIVPSSITLMTTLIRELVPDPRKIEKACGTVQKVISIQDDTVSTTIRRAAGFLKEGAPKVALDILLIADNKYPDNPNLKCMLGQAYLDVKPPMAEKAEQSLRQAYEMGCSRPEMLSLWVKAKERREDWKGIVALTRLEDLPVPQSEKIFFRVEAYSKLAELADRSGSASTCLEYHRKIITAITRAFQRKQTRGRVNEFNERLRLSFQRYIGLTDQMATNAFKHIDVWEACYRAFAVHIFHSEYIRRGVERLSSWWNAVESQQRFDTRKVKTLEVQLRRLDKILNFLRSPNLSFPELIEFVRFHKQALTARLQAYKARTDH